MSEEESVPTAPTETHVQTSAEREASLQAAADQAVAGSPDALRRELDQAYDPSLSPAGRPWTGTIYDWQGPPAAGNFPPYKPARPCDHATGVRFVAPYEHPVDGFAEHARRLCEALATTTTAVQLMSTDPMAVLDRIPGTIEVLERMAPHHRTTIAAPVAEIHCVIPTPATLHSYVHHKYWPTEYVHAVARRRALYTVWERSHLPPWAVEPLRVMGQNWVGCQMSRAMLLAHGLDSDRVHVVPCPYRPDDPLLGLDGRRRDPTARPRFLHVGKWEPRKEQRNILGAYLLAFEPGEALLYMKTSERAPAYTSYPSSPGQAMASWLVDPRVQARGWTAARAQQDIRLVRKTLTRAELVRLYAASDVYVSLARGEGYDMPAFDAKLAGNLLVYTPSGGPQDYAGTGDELVPTTGTVPADPWYRWEPGAAYLDYDLDQAAAALRRAADRVRQGGRTRGIDLTAYRLEAVGATMARHLARLVADNPLIVDVPVAIAPPEEPVPAGGPPSGDAS
jgi:glycosyltransferase involved in cell wall biosynthesis